LTKDGHNIIQKVVPIRTKGFKQKILTESSHLQLETLIRQQTLLVSSFKTFSKN